MAGVLLSGASDERLVELARAGDERAFDAIVERYRAPLLHYCRGMLPAAAADDAVQQTFINAYKALSGDQAPVALRPWLYRVARNAALNVARDPQAGLEELPEGLDGVRRPDEVVQARERFRRVVGAVTNLPPKQRQVIVRHALDGDSHERIATDLGMSAGSIRQLVHRARQTVREAAAALLPTPLLRFLPVGADAAEAGSGAALAKVAVAAVVVGAAGGGAVEVVKRDAEQPAAAEVRKAPERRDRAAARPAVTLPAPAVVGGAGDGSSRTTSGEDGSSGGGERGSRKRSGSKGRGSGGGSGSSGSSGSGSSGSDSSGSSGSGSSGSGSGSSGSDSSGSGSSGSGSSGSDSSGSGSGSSGSGSSGSDSSGSGSGSSGSGSSGSGISGSSGSGSSGSGSSGSDSSGSGSSGSGSSDSASSGSGSSGSGSSDSDSSGSGSSGSGSDDD